jgi:hypothetical protein
MKYLITSTVWNGEIELEYCENSLMNSLSLKNADLSEQQHIIFLKILPRELAELHALMAKQPNLVLTEIKEEITFDMFWKKYQAPELSKKKKALTAWNRLTEANRIKAFNYIQKYISRMQSWQSKQYAETYLNSDIWNN